MVTVAEANGPPRPRRYDDVNAVVGGLLRDLASVQTSPQRTFGYKRAAAAVLSLDQPLTQLRLPDGTLEKIPGIGPASSRVILEVLDMGNSPTVERAVEVSGRAKEIDTRRALRRHFLSRAEVARILSDPAFDGLGFPTTTATCRCIRNGATVRRRSTKSAKPAWHAATASPLSPTTPTV